MYRLPAVYYRIVLTRDWNVKLGPHVIGTHLDTSAYIVDLDGFFTRIEAKKQVRIKESNQKTVIFMTFEEAKQQAIERSEWVMCHGACYYTARRRRQKRRRRSSIYGHAITHTLNYQNNAH